ncbi:extracellular neutral protease B [alpha proteobacterium U9-1i]|nr:extracellular neutral protease B [alpha proteobacterium U9-1i]
MRGKFLFGAASAALLVGLGFAGSASAQQADPPGDNTTQVVLAPGQETSGTLYPAGDKDWYRLNVTPGQRYSFTLNGVTEGETTLDPVLAIYNAAGEQIAGNDDANGSLNAALNFTPTEAGFVFVEARGFSEDAAGGYVLNVSAGPVPPDDAGNDATTRARVTPGGAVSGTLESEGDVDWYRLSARTSQRYRIALNGADGDGALGDPVLRVIDSNGVEVAANDDSETGLNSLLEFSPNANGDVFIEAGGFGGQATGAYTLNVTAERAPTDSVAGDSHTRGRLALDASVSDGLDFAGDRDWRRIRLEGGQSYRFTLNSNTDAATPLTDPLIKIFGNDSVELAADDDGGDGFNSYLEFTAPESGNYFVEARGFGDDATGGYTLTARAGDIPADASTDASLSADGDFRSGVLSPAGDRDWYRIELAEGQGLRLAVAGAEGVPGGVLSDPYIALYGPDGNVVAENDDANGDLNSWLEYSAAAAGAHYLEVRGFSAETAEGAYTIQLTAGEIGASSDTAEYIMAAGAPRQSTIATAGDADWYGIDLVEGRAYRINLVSSDGTLDPVVTLFNAEGQAIATDDDGGTGVNAYLTYVPITGGTHYIAAAAYESQTTGGYMLTINDTEVLGSPGSDEMLDANGDDRLSRIDMPGDLDAYGVTLEGGVRYTIEVRGEGDNPLTDAFVAVLDSSGARVASDDDSGPGLDARVTFTAAATDQFYIQASGLGGGTGWYRVSIAR